MTRNLEEWLTVVIPTKNAAAQLLQCLQCVPSRIHVIVVDSRSADETRSVAEKHGAQYVSFSWNGRFPKKRNWVLDSGLVKTPWVLMLDADERLTPGFLKEVGARVPESTHVAFETRYKNRFMGKRLRFGDPMRKIALFRADIVRYERVADSVRDSFDMEVHEHPVFSGTCGRIRASMEHIVHETTEEYVSKHIRYAQWETGRYGSLRVARNASWRLRIKSLLVGSPVLPVTYLLYSYVMRAGFLDGRAGWDFALLKAAYFHTVSLMVQEERLRSV